MLSNRVLFLFSVSGKSYLLRRVAQGWSPQRNIPQLLPVLGVLRKLSNDRQNDIGTLHQSFRLEVHHQVTRGVLQGLPDPVDLGQKIKFNTFEILAFRSLYLHVIQNLIKNIVFLVQIVPPYFLEKSLDPHI